MHPDEDANLKAAFAELQRRRREQAPPFGSMREHALARADDREGLRQHSMMPRLAWAAAAIGVAAAVIWRAGSLPGPTGVQSAARLNSAERADQLITAIEQHLELKDSLSSLEYPSDVLLAENQTDF